MDEETAGMGTVSPEHLEEWGWEKPEKSGGKYLRLDGKGDMVRIRLVSKPLAFDEEVTFKEKTKTVRQHAFLVIHKELVGGKLQKSVKGFKAGPMIYGLMFNFVSSPDWGNPTTYDFEITRTEEQNNFYTVRAMPKGMGPLSEADKGLIAEANLDLHALFLSDDTQEAPPETVEGDPYADE